MSGRVARFLGVCRVQPIAVEQAEAFDGLILFAWLLFGEQRGHVLVCYHLWRRGRIQVLHRVVLLARQVDIVDGVLARSLDLVGDVLVDHLLGARADLIEEVYVARELLMSSCV